MTMKTKSITIGLDVGNHDTKTQSTSTPSGFSKCSKPPFSSKECLTFNGFYYTPDDLSRFPYTQDKTMSENCFILSLFGIAKEIIHFVTKNYSRKDKNNPSKPSKQSIQQEIDNIDTVHLGVGLPPTHCATLSEKTVKYYKENFGDGVQFQYEDYIFHLQLGECKVFAQDFAAIVSYKLKHKEDPECIVRKYKSYCAIDIGGWTADVIPFVNSKPSIKNCESKPLGILKFYESAIADIEQETGIRLISSSIEDVLRGNETILSDEIKEIIEQKASEWLDKTIQLLAQFGVDFNNYPIVFIGGGCLLLKKYIDNCSALKKYDIISDIHANADGYTRLLRAYLNTQ